MYRILLLMLFLDHDSLLYLWIYGLCPHAIGDQMLQLFHLMTVTTWDFPDQLMSCVWSFGPA